MELGYILTLVAVFVIGVVFGKSERNMSKYGVVYVDQSESLERPDLFLEPSVPITAIMANKRVTFDVRVIK